MIDRSLFGYLHDGREVNLFTLSNSNGMRVVVSELGAAIISIFLPQKNGNDVDVVLGFDNVAAYETQKENFGVVVGRHAGRIEKGEFSLNSTDYSLCINSGPNHIHGGINGFSKKLWMASYRQNVLTLFYISPDGEEGYPGTLCVSVQYQLDSDNRLIIVYDAFTKDKDTVINLTNHSYFNLRGHDDNHALQQKLEINATLFAAIDDTKKPTGEIMSVYDTALDFSEPRVIGDKINSDEAQMSFAGGYDHFFVLNKKSRNSCDFAARMSDSDSGRSVEVYTTFPGVQLYTGNYLDGQTLGKKGVYYQKNAGICLETQGFPNAMSCTHFPSPVLTEGEKYNHTTIYKFNF